jgi:hypothetical protein
MRCTKLCFWGSVATFGYTLAILVVGSIKMSQKDAVRNTAQSELDAATNQYNIANNAYQTALNNMRDAQQKIGDANCYVSGFTNFAMALNAYCNPNSSGNVLTDLNIAYGINIIAKSDTIRTTSRSECDWVSVPYSCQKTDANGKPYTSTCYSLECFRYTITTTYTTTYGTTITGAGSSQQNNCGRYNAGIQITSREFLKSSTGVQRINKYTESKTDTYASQQVTGALLDNDAKTINYEVDPKNINYQAIAVNLLAQVNQQCIYLLSAIKPPSFYQAIINATQAQLPALQLEINTTGYILNNATAKRSTKQFVFDHANDNSKLEYSLWLPLLFLVPAAALVLLISYEGYAESVGYSGFSTCSDDPEQTCACCYQWQRTREAQNRSRSYMVHHTSSTTTATTSSTARASVIDSVPVRPNIPVAQVVEDATGAYGNAVPEAQLQPDPDQTLKNALAMA